MVEHKSFYFCPLLVATIFIVVNTVAFCLFEFTDVNFWIHVLTIEGLATDGIGAGIVLIPDLIGARDSLIPSDEIRQLDEARETIFKERGLNRQEADEEIFEKILEIILKNRELKKNPEHVNQISSTPAVKEGENRIFFGGNIFVGYHGDVEVIGNQVMVDGWINQYRQELINRATQIPLRVGLSLFMLGFSIQLVAQIISLNSI